MTHKPETRLFLSVSEAAEVLGVDPRTLRRAVERGEVPGKRIGSRVLIPAAWLRSQSQDGQATDV